MSLDPLFRRMTMLVTGFVFIGVVLGSISLFTHSWTKGIIPATSIPIPMRNSTDMNDNTVREWNGLYRRCSSFNNNQCEGAFLPSIFLLCSFGLICLLIAGILSFMELIRTSDRRFFIPLLLLMSCILMTAGLFDYGSRQRINSYSSRLMLSSIVFVYISLTISSFITGRYSAYQRYINNGHINNGQKYIPTSTNSN